MNQNYFDFTGYFTIIVTERVSDDSLTIITKILIECWHHQITNVIVLIDGVDDDRSIWKTIIYTYFPYSSPSDCGRVNPVVMAEFNQNILKWHTTIATEIFPEKSNSLHGCPLNLCTFRAVEPLIILKANSLSTSSYTLYGIEGYIYGMLAARLNFTTNIVLSPNNELGGAAHSNGTMTGCMKLVYSTDTERVNIKENKVQKLFSIVIQMNEGRANLSIGGLAYTEQRSRWFSAIFPHYHADLRFAIPPPKPFTNFERLFIPFNWTIWCAISATFTIGFIIIIALRWPATRTTVVRVRRLVIGRRTNRTPWMHMVNSCLGGAVTAEPQRNFGRTIFFVWMLGCFVLRNAYQGELFDVLQSSSLIGQPKNTLDALVTANYTLYMLPAQMYFFDNIPKAKQKYL